MINIKSFKNFEEKEEKLAQTIIKKRNKLAREIEVGEKEKVRKADPTDNIADLAATSTANKPDPDQKPGIVV